MKKKVALIVVASMLFGGAVSAASLWGTYKGNQIIRLTLNGSPVSVSDVPAVSLNGRTMIPIYLLKQAGVSYSWDQSKQTVDIKSGSSSSGSNNTSIDQIAAAFKSRNVSLVSYMTDGSNSFISFYYNFGMFDESEAVFNALFDDAMEASIKTQAKTFEFIDKNNAKLSLQVSTIRSFLNGSITADALYNSMVVTGLSSAPEIVSSVTYPSLYSYDGKTYLGKITSNSFDTDSVFNEFGTYGSKFSTSSIWDEFGDYGSSFSNTSAFNKLASQPPAIVLNGKFIGYVTVNSSFPNAISPGALLEWAKKNGY
ncbi:hypothetical protein J19TS2_31340 [Cohnella xylanilytica]|uniref:stalk domain-containing protein n=1 Tax=Cohnella xylanilytica TaxID=557555 RepID=UPI001B1DD3F4|nr:stalk domain-containing protein [Cohnella xylanilytica]GIO13579.1 hypothetical protein J19TS2_31340 [Cohnella xylanilytica]